MPLPHTQPSMNVKVGSAQLEDHYDGSQSILPDEPVCKIFNKSPSTSHDIKLTTLLNGNRFKILHILWKIKPTTNVRNERQYKSTNGRVYLSLYKHRIQSSSLALLQVQWSGRKIQIKWLLNDYDYFLKYSKFCVWGFSI